MILGEAIHRLHHTPCSHIYQLSYSHAVISGKIVYTSHNASLCCVCWSPGEESVLDWMVGPRHMVNTKHETSLFGHEYALNANGVWHNCGSGNPAHRSSHTSGKIKTELSWPLFLRIDMRGILSQVCVTLFFMFKSAVGHGPTLSVPYFIQLFPMHRRRRLRYRPKACIQRKPMSQWYFLS